jgi:hypothetical protein
MRKAVKKVFLSYDRSDEKAAREISSVLQGAGFDLWDPGWEILQDRIVNSLQDALNVSTAGN